MTRSCECESLASPRQVTFLLSWWAVRWKNARDRARAQVCTMYTHHVPACERAGTAITPVGGPRS